MSTVPAVSPALRRKTIVASTLGNVFSWFGFTVYGLFAVIITKLYFPAESETASWLASVAALSLMVLLMAQILPALCMGFVWSARDERLSRRTPDGNPGLPG